MTDKSDDEKNEMPPSPNPLNPNIPPTVQAMPDFRSLWYPIRLGKSGVEKMQKKIVKEKSERALKILRAYTTE